MSDGSPSSFPLCGHERCGLPQTVDDLFRGLVHAMIAEREEGRVEDD